AVGPQGPREFKSLPLRHSGILMLPPLRRSANAALELGLALSVDAASRYPDHAREWTDLAEAGLLSVGIRYSLLPHIRSLHVVLRTQLSLPQRFAATNPDQLSRAVRRTGCFGRFVAIF